MLVGPFPIGLVVGSAAVILFSHNVVPALGPSRRTLIDRLVGTTVVRTSIRATAAPARATMLGPHGFTLRATVTRVASGATTAAGRAVSDAQAQAMTVAGAGRVRYLSRRAPERIPSIGRNTRHLWR
jgi:hypothetical protein